MQFKEVNVVEIFTEDEYFKCIDGKKRKNGIIGYCHNMIHLGYITVKLMQEHGCIDKNCKYFAKYTDRPFWIQKEKSKEKKIKALDSKRKKDERDKIIEKIMKI